MSAKTIYSINQFAESDQRRFWDKVNPDHRLPSDCWDWMATRITGGYGVFYLHRDSTVAHRVAMILRNGGVDPTLDVLHSCDNPSCVNPSHLWIGTHQANMIDKEKKGRGNHCFGDSNGTRKKPSTVPKGSSHLKSKFKEEDIVKIRQMGRGVGRWEESSGLTEKEIAKQFNCNSSTIHSILKRKTWKHVV